MEMIAPPGATGDVITSEAELRTLIGVPTELVEAKKLPALDKYCRAFIAKSPFVLLGTFSAAGDCDVSPRGDPPGFVHVIDDTTLAIPERPGNRLADSLHNILETGQIGMLVVVPNVNETLRINGRATLVRTPELLDAMAVQGKRPVLAIRVEVRECFFHCARSFLRGHIWDPPSWIDRSELPTLGQIIADEIRALPVNAAELDKSLAESNRQLY